MGANYLREAFGTEAADLSLPFVRDHARRWGPVLEMAVKGVNAPLTSSAGRLFDAAAAIAGLRGTVNYEGQAAIELEQLADPTETDTLRVMCTRSTNGFEISGADLVRAVAEHLLRQVKPSTIAGRFHNSVAEAILHLPEVDDKKSGGEEKTQWRIGTLFSFLKQSRS